MINLSFTVVKATTEDRAKTGMYKVTVRDNNITGVVFYPNPLSGNQINIQMPDQQSGKFMECFTDLPG